MNMENYQVYFTISMAINFLWQATILIFALVYFIKSKTLGSALMLLGSLLLVLVKIAQPVMSWIVSFDGNPNELIVAQGIFGILASLFGIVFAIGFALSILSTVSMLNRQGLHP